MPVIEEGTVQEPTEDGPEQAEDGPEQKDGEGARSRRRPDWMRWLGLALAVLVCASGLIAWWSASRSDDLEVARMRDAALIDATRHIETLNTLDHRDVDAGLAAWGDATTGVLHDQVTSVSDADRKTLAEAEKVSVGKVLDAAVVDLDPERGTATVIASVEVTVSGEDGEPSVKRNRFSADVVDVKGDWLLESLQQVAVSL